MSSAAEVIYLPAMNVIPPIRPRASDFSSAQDRWGIRGLLDQLGQLGIDPPPGARESFEEAGRLQREARSVQSSAEDTPVTIAGGAIITSGQRHARDLRAAAGAAYVHAARAFIDHSDALIGGLRVALAEVIAQQQQSEHPLAHPALQARYDLVRATARRLRWATGDAEGASALWWEYAKPERVHAWLAAEVDLRSHLRPRPRELGSLTIRATLQRDDATVVHMTSARGITIDLALIAAHARDWEPEIMLAEEVAANVARVRTALNLDAAAIVVARPAAVW